MSTKLGKRIWRTLGLTTDGSDNIAEFANSSDVLVQSINSLGQLQLTQENVFVGNASNRTIERAVTNQIVGVDSLVAGQCTVIDTRITSNSIVVYGISNVGTLVGDFTYDVTTTAGRCVFSSTDLGDDVTFSYIIIL